MSEDIMIDVCLEFHTNTPDGNPAMTETAVAKIVDAIELINDPIAKVQAQALMGCCLAMVDYNKSRFTYVLMDCFIMKTRDKYGVPWVVDYVDVTEKTMLSL